MSDDEPRVGIGEVGGCSDVVPVDVGEDNVVNVIRSQATLGERCDNVGERVHWLPCRDVFANWGGVSVGVAAQAQVEEKTGCFLGCGRSGVLDEECEGGGGAGRGCGGRSDEEALGEGKATSGEGMDCYSGWDIGFHGG